MNKRSTRSVHQSAAFMAEALFDDGLLCLQQSAEILRGSDIHQSEEAMKCERALTKAIELLKASGFRAPEKCE